MFKRKADKIENKRKLKDKELSKLKEKQKTDEKEINKKEELGNWSVVWILLLTVFFGLVFYWS